MTEATRTPPEHLPESVLEDLQDSSDAQLREIIHYAQQLLNEHPSLTDAIESREGEKLIRTEDHGAYTSVILERPGESGEARGPFAYRVRWEPAVKEGNGKYQWHYLGRVRDTRGNH